MEQYTDSDYNRIAKAIKYIKDNFKAQPSLDEVADHVHLSASRFQRLFTDWAGTSPKKFLQYISIQHAKQLLVEQQATLFDTAIDLGMSSSSRLHDLFVTVEGMTPAEYKNGGKDLAINYSFYDSPFGLVLVASTGKGVCHMAFEEDKALAVANLRLRFPNAYYVQQTDSHQQKALRIFQRDYTDLGEVKLHLKGTAFQLKVWQSLLDIPMGRLSTYGSIAKQIGDPKASRAVGTAIGSNPIAYLIPCHRVIQSTGQTGGYMWGPDRKVIILGWEAAQRNR